MENRTLSVIASFLAIVFVVAAYFVKKKSLYLLSELLCIVFLTVSYFFNVQYYAMIGLTIGFFRTITFFIYEKKDKTAPMIWSFVFFALTVVSYFVINHDILKKTQALDILCMAALVLYAFIFRIRDLKTVCFIMLIPTCLSILYNVLTNAALFVTLTYVFELCADVVAIFRYFFNHGKFGEGSDLK